MGLIRRIKVFRIEILLGLFNIFVLYNKNNKIYFKENNNLIIDGKVKRSRIKTFS